MSGRKHQRLLQLACRLERIADTRHSFDDFVQDLSHSHDGLSEALDSAQSVKETLTRSGYSGLANKLSTCIDHIQDVSEVMDTLRKMHAQGKLSYGPRVPRSVTERGTRREDSIRDRQERPRAQRPTRKLFQD